MSFNNGNRRNDLSMKERSSSLPEDANEKRLPRQTTYPCSTCSFTTAELRAKSVRSRSVGQQFKGVSPRVHVPLHRRCALMKQYSWKGSPRTRLRRCLSGQKQCPYPPESFHDPCSNCRFKLIRDGYTTYLYPLRGKSGSSCVLLYSTFVGLGVG
jgi:hypothetical protein